MIAKETIENILKDYLIENKLELVSIKINQANNIKVFFTALDRNIDIQDCSTMSKFIEKHLDRDKEDFSLTISSAEKK
ncbi:MAG: hypothetical protein WC140_07620 [Bacteroidales bacterium]